MAVRRLERLEKENFQLEDEEHEASFADVLADKAKVAKLLVETWFVDKASASAKSPPTKSSSSTPALSKAPRSSRSAQDAWVQVVNDDARAQEEGVTSTQNFGDRNAWKEERDKEKASSVARQVRRAAALTAELAAQSENKVSVVCDHPLGLRDEPAKPGNVTSLATSSPFSLVASSSLLASDSSPSRPRPLQPRRRGPWSSTTNGRECPRSRSLAAGNNRSPHMCTFRVLWLSCETPAACRPPWAFTRQPEGENEHI